MHAPAVRNPLARTGAETIRAGFDRYQAAFLEVTLRAKGRFETRDWLGMHADTRERLDLYEEVIAGVVTELHRTLAGRADDEALWGAMRATYAEQIAGHHAAEVAETFFNSVTRRIVRTVGINPALEFLDFRFERVPLSLVDRPWRTFVVHAGVAAAVRTALERCGFVAPFVDLAATAGAVAARIERAWEAGLAPITIEELEFLEAVFYRRKGAYVIGRARGANRVMPLVLALVHGDRGIAVDAVLTTETETSIVFSFTRSYFHAAITRPAETIDFLRTLMPVKPVNELYAALGYHKHGKTEFYRELQRHLLRTDERFEIAAGTPGMVMTVFALPSFDTVFKVIRDTFGPPKQTTPDEVKRRYRMVFAHDRAGRLVDAQPFEGMSFPRARFSRALLDELLGSAARSVRVEGDQVVIDHLYTERRVRPLDLYLHDADAADALRVVVDYGKAIRDLAATNVFPGDFLLKNFGVTRHGRVVFYDYDELRLLTECAFRAQPAARHDEDDLAAEPWYYVGPNDVFPEELARFVPFDGDLRDAFLSAHADLYSVSYWNTLKARHVAEDLVDIFPYGEENRISLPS